MNLHSLLVYIEHKGDESPKASKYLQIYTHTVTALKSITTITAYQQKLYRNATTLTIDNTQFVTYSKFCNKISKALKTVTYNIFWMMED